MPGGPAGGRTFSRRSQMPRVEITSPPSSRSPRASVLPTSPRASRWTRQGRGMTGGAAEKGCRSQLTKRIFPYASPDLSEDCADGSTYRLSLVCLENARDILLTLEAGTGDDRRRGGEGVPVTVDKAMRRKVFHNHPPITILKFAWSRRSISMSLSRYAEARRGRGGSPRSRSWMWMTFWTATCSSSAPPGSCRTNSPGAAGAFQCRCPDTRKRPG